jgi:hypothetical protein
MEVFRILNPIQAPAPVVFTVEQSVIIFNLHKEGKPALAIAQELGLNTNRVKILLLRFAEIRDMMERIIKGEAHLEKGYTIPAEYDEIGEVVVEAIVIEPVMVPVPQTLTKLIERSLELIDKDRPMSEDPIFTANTIEEVVEAVALVATEVIRLSKLEQDGTFDWWKDILTQ